jgi:hypothetical protein
VSLPRHFTAEEATGISTPGSWAEDGAFRYCPYRGHELFVRRSRIDEGVLAAFHGGTLELAWEARALLTLALAWKFSLVDTWEGSIYSYRRTDPGRWPVADDIRDERLVPLSARTIQVRLIDPAGKTAAERVVLASQRWAFHFLNRIVLQDAAYDRGSWFRNSRDDLLHFYRTPAELAGAVTMVSPPPTLPNPKRFQYCLCESIPEATP